MSSNNGIVVVGNDIHPGIDRVGSRSGWDTDPGSRYVIRPAWRRE
jgi:hypothetical protein